MPVMGGNPGPALRSPVTTLIDAVVLDDNPTAYNSASLDCSLYRRGLLHLSLLSTSTPTDLRIILQWSPDGGTTWFDYKKDELVSLFYEDQDLATAQTEVYGFDVLGRLLRVRIVGTGTTSSAKFTVTAKVELML